MHTILNTLALVSIVSTTPGQLYTNEKLKNTGIFFEKTEDITFYTNQLKIITTINIPETRQISDTLADCNMHLKTLCDEILKRNPTDLCRPLRTEIEWHIGQIRKQDIKIKEMYNRQKRGLVNLGGRFAKFVLGTMDSEDSKKIYKQLQNIEHRQTEITKVENEHIAVLKSNFDALAKPIEVLQNETYIIEQKLNQLIQKDNNRDDEYILQEMIDHQVTEIISLVIVQSLHIKSLQEEASEIVMALDSKILHPLVLPYGKIVEVLKVQNPNTNERMKIHEILRRIITIDYTELEGKLLVKVTIPLMEDNTYKLYRPHLIPFKTNQGYKTYVTDTEYIAINKELSNTVELTSKDLTRCKTITDSTEGKEQLCQHTQPTWTITDKNCLQMLLTEHFEVQEQCLTLPTNSANTFIRLEHGNSWLYALTQATNIVIQCGKTTESLRISETGMIIFKAACKIITKDFTTEIAGQPTTIEIKQPEIQPEVAQDEKIDWSLTHTPITDTERKIQTLKLIDNKQFRNSLIEEANKIKHLKEVAEEINRRSDEHKSDIRDQTVIVFSTIIVIIIVITIIIHIRSRKLQSKTPTININNIEAERKIETNNTPPTEERLHRYDGIRVI